MTLLQQIRQWGETHHPRWMDIVRIALGIFLCYKGVEFVSEMSSVMNLLESRFTFGHFALLLLGHYIAFAHILGGVLLVLGMLTRFACLIQIPILLGAIIFINSSMGLWQPFSELWLSIIVLLLLFYFLIVGDGPWSFYKLSEEPEENKQ